MSEVFGEPVIEVSVVKSPYIIVLEKLKEEYNNAVLRADINRIKEVIKYVEDLKKIDYDTSLTFPTLIKKYNEKIKDEKRQKIFEKIADYAEIGKPGMPKIFYESFPPTNPMIKILLLILVVSLIIIGILFVLGLIFGFIYAIRAEFREKNKSVLRVIGRTFLGFVFVARYWSMYGFW